ERRGRRERDHGDTGADQRARRLLRSTGGDGFAHRHFELPAGAQSVQRMEPNADGRDHLSIAPTLVRINAASPSPDLTTAYHFARHNRLVDVHAHAAAENLIRATAAKPTCPTRSAPTAATQPAATARWIG